MGMRGPRVRLGMAVGCVFAVLSCPAGALAQSGPTLPTNDLQDLLALTGAQTPPRAPYQHAEPPLQPVPRANCDASSHPLAGEQGRVPASAIDSPQAARGWTCNLEVVSHYDATPGGFRTWRYTDTNGHTCAFYDSSLSSPLDVVSLAAAPTQGVVVLDMTDPARPLRTDTLTAPGMLSPHESLNLNVKRGLLGAEPGTGATLPGELSLYDVSTDCRHPLHQSDYAAAPFGHESGFAADGKTFWIGGGQGIAAVDVSDPKNPFTIWKGNEFAHGLNVSDDGNTLYDTNPIDGGLTLLDVSQIQARKPAPLAREISRLTWETTSIPQNTNPITIGGRPYLLEYDEFAFRFNPPTSDDKAGAARLIDIADPAHPRVVSNLRLEVNMPAAHKEAAGDPSFMPGSATSYGAHYCNVPREVDPEIAACSFLNSGLRVFDISDPLHPREVAYFVSPPGQSSGGKADAAFSQPAFDPARRQVWFTDAVTGFYALKLADAAWPHPVAQPVAHCASKRTELIHVRRPRHGRIVSVKITVGGRRVPVHRVGGRYVARIVMTGRPRVTVHVRIRVRTSAHRTYDDSRTYHPCRPGPKAAHKGA
jgi:hypothetical protein